MKKNKDLNLGEYLDYIDSNYIVCHNYYDKKSRRISAFGFYNPSNSNLTIYTITCSEKDTFSKKESRIRLALYLREASNKSYKNDPLVIHPVMYSIPTTKENSRKEFFNFLNEKFYKKDVLEVMLENADKMILSDVLVNIVSGEVLVSNTRTKHIKDNKRGIVINYVNLN